MVVDRRDSYHCLGFETRELTIPPFAMPTGSIIGVSVPIPFGQSWVDTMHMLSGETQTPHIFMDGAGVSVIPQVATLRRVPHHSSLEELSRLDSPMGGCAKSLINQRGFAPKVRVDQLPQTATLLLEIACALASRPGIVVFTSAGLDPLGVTAVQSSIESHLDPMSGLHVYSRSVESSVLQSVTLDAIVSCGSLEK